MDIAASITDLIRLVDDWILREQFFGPHEAELIRRYQSQDGTPDAIALIDEKAAEVSRLKDEIHHFAGRVIETGRPLWQALVTEGAEKSAVMVAKVLYFAERGGGARRLQPEWPDVRSQLECEAMRLTTKPSGGEALAKGEGIPAEFRNSGHPSGEPLTAIFINNRFAVSPSTLTRWHEAGKLERLKVGRAFVYRFRDLAAQLDRAEDLDE